MDRQTWVRVLGWAVSSAALVAILVPLAAVSQGQEKRPAAAAGDPALIERGRTLVMIGGCNDCHTPWKMEPGAVGPQPDMTRMLSGHPAGAPDPVSQYQAPDMGIIGPTFTSFRLPFGVVYAANLTPDPKTGMGGWSKEQFVMAMRTGRHKGEPGRPILPPMPWFNLASAEQADLEAIFAYLQSIPAIENAVPENKVPAEVLAQMGGGGAPAK